MWDEMKVKYWWESHQVAPARRIERHPAFAHIFESESNNDNQTCTTTNEQLAFDRRSVK
jgi:hypothetical protein